MIPEKSTTASLWHECPPGTLRQLSSHLRASKRNQMIRRVGSVLAIVVVTTAGAWNTVSTGQHKLYFDGISCADTQSQLNHYVAGQLPKSTINSINAHLRSCPACSAKLRQMRTHSTGEDSRVSLWKYVININYPGLWTKVPDASSTRQASGAAYGSPSLLASGERGLRCRILVWRLPG